MEPRGSQLDSSLPQPENPCLIVEDSQPDSVALEDDPESSYRALLARRLSSLQPAARPACSPVLVGITLISHRFVHLPWVSLYFVLGCTSYRGQGRQNVVRRTGAGVPGSDLFSGSNTK